MNTLKLTLLADIHVVPNLLVSTSDERHMLALKGLGMGPDDDILRKRVSQYFVLKSPAMGANVCQQNATHTNTVTKENYETESKDDPGT